MTFKAPRSASEACCCGRSTRGRAGGRCARIAWTRGVSETLKVTPQRKVLQHVTPGRGGIGKLQNVINLHFEGNWMPIKARLLAARLRLCPTAPVPLFLLLFRTGSCVSSSSLWDIWKLPICGCK